MKQAHWIERIILRKLDNERTLKPVSAHCDVPCGIYETDSMTHAAETVCKMMEKMQALEKPKQGDEKADLEYRNTFVRMVETKEKFAQKCKEEILILWTDYFKQEHIMKISNLHELIWKTTQLCSSAKRTADVKVGEELKKAVQEVAEAFKKTKQ